MHDFGQALHNAREANPSHILVTFKSDIQSAFLNLPVHPVWQLGQVVVIKGKLYTVQWLVFGNWGSPKIWCGVSWIIAWIVIITVVWRGCLFIWMTFLVGILGTILFAIEAYTDLSNRSSYFSFGNLYHAPLKIENYSMAYHSRSYIDIMKGTISLSPNSIDKIVDKSDQFLQHSCTNHAPKLHGWQQLTGNLNWLLSMLPCHHLVLQALYDKMKSKYFSSSGAFHNISVIHNFIWLWNTIPQSIGICFVNEDQWADADADFVMWTNASSNSSLLNVYDDGPICCLCLPTMWTAITAKESQYFLPWIVGNFVWYFPCCHIFLMPPTSPLDLHIQPLVPLLSSAFFRLASHYTMIPFLQLLESFYILGLTFVYGTSKVQKNIWADLISHLLFDDFESQFTIHSINWFVPPAELLSELEHIWLQRFFGFFGSHNLWCRKVYNRHSDCCYHARSRYLHVYS